MEFALIKFVAELLLRTCAQLLKLEHADFIGARLSRINNVALDFRSHFFFADSGFVAHISDGLLARPMFRVNSSIDHEPDRAEKFVAQTTEISERVLVVPTGLLGQPFAIKRPAL